MNTLKSGLALELEEELKRRFRMFRRKAWWERLDYQLGKVRDHTNYEFDVYDVRERAKLLISSGWKEVYMKPCCSNPLPVGTLTNDQVKCLNCGEETRLQDLPNYNDPFYYDPPTPRASVGIEVRCQCGSDKTYGVNSVTHSSWCPMYRKG